MFLHTPPQTSTLLHRPPHSSTLLHRPPHSSTDLQWTMDTAGFLVLLLRSSFLLFCSSDIDSVREMGAALAAQQVQIKQLQEENLENKVQMEKVLEKNKVNNVIIKL
uniref:Uncharacterized protein n=1 Tax=Knipowitschia caucasica TaxID=637954 RepID=A0AAV2MHA7_KNICA